MEYLPDFAVHNPQSVDDAVKLRAEHEGARYLAGGTDMIVNIRRGIERPSALIDLSAIAELHDVRQEDDGLRIGAAVTLETLAEHAAISEVYPAVAQAAASIAGPTHRAYGTVGGNLCLDTRCLFYNQSEWWRTSNEFCLKHGGEVCHVAPGGTFCFAPFSGDLAPAMMVHEAMADLVGPRRRRTVALADLYRDDGMDHLTIEPGELLTSVLLPKATAGIPSGYQKARIRGSIDFPLAGVAVRLAMKDGAVDDLRIALTAVNPRPLLLEGTDKYIGTKLDGAALDEIRELARAQSKPMRTTTTAPWYRRRVVGALTRRLVARLASA
jgi:4-hydroxybenzoyl-CoA reductase subunit beta